VYLLIVALNEVLLAGNWIGTPTRMHYPCSRHHMSDGEHPHQSLGYGRNKICLLQIHVFFTLAWSASRTGRFSSLERASTNCWIGSWVSPGISLDDVEKISAPTGTHTATRLSSSPKPVAAWPRKTFLIFHKNIVTCLSDCRRGAD
jgi:hypothetical protein